MRPIFTIVAASAAALLTVCGPAWAQANRTFVSGHGGDTGNCGLGAPCRSFAYAITQTNAGGEITILDPAGYGSVTINKSISIVNDGVGEAGVTVTSATNAITISVGANDVVNLRGLTLVGGGVGTNGITFNNQGALNIQNSVIRGFTSNGINLVAAGTAAFNVSDTIVSNASLDGIVVQPSGAGTITAAFTRVQAVGNGGSGFFIGGANSSGAVNVTITNSVATNNNGSGVLGASDIGRAPTKVMVSNSVLSNNNQNGVEDSGANSTTYITKNTIVGNPSAGGVFDNGTLFSSGDNYIKGNGNDNTGALTPPASCSWTTTLPDGCAQAQAHGTIVDAHLADPQAVIALDVVGGSGYTNGTYTWMSSGGGATRDATGTITVSGGMLGGATRGSLYTITDGGAGFTGSARLSITIPTAAGPGTGGAIKAEILQLTPHNAPVTWSVPGVDYPVGYDTTLGLADPTSRANLPGCAAFSGHTVTISGNNCTINGFDFASKGTHLVINGGVIGCHITNNKFKIRTDLDSIHQNSGASDCEIAYNTFDGSSVLGSGSGISGGAVANVDSAATSGTLNFHHNYCFLPDSKCLNLEGTSSSTLAIIEQYNYYGELGTCQGRCAHGEAEYSFGATTQILYWDQKFNVAINHYYSGPTNLTSEMAFVGDRMAITGNSEYNYVLALGTQPYTGSNNGSGQVASASVFCGSQEGGSANGTLSNNILAYSGAFFPFNTSGGTCQTAYTMTGNLNAGSGHSCSASSCN